MWTKIRFAFEVFLVSVCLAFAILCLKHEVIRECGGHCEAGKACWFGEGSADGNPTSEP